MQLLWYCCPQQCSITELSVKTTRLRFWYRTWGNEGLLYLCRSGRILTHCRTTIVGITTANATVGQRSPGIVKVWVLGGTDYEVSRQQRRPVICDKKWKDFFTAASTILSAAKMQGSYMGNRAIFASIKSESHRLDNGSIFVRCRRSSAVFRTSPARSLKPPPYLSAYQYYATGESINLPFKAWDWRIDSNESHWIVTNEDLSLLVRSFACLYFRVWCI